MQAIILAGGFGKRLKSVIGQEIPKPMAPVEGEPFLAHYIRYLREQGVSEVLLSLHHLAETVQRHFGDGFEGVSIRYAVEECPLGTGGAVKFALAHLKPQVPVLVVNGDSFVDIDIAAMLRAHEKANAKLSIALREMPDCSRYGEVLFDASERIVSFQYPGRAQAGWISTGCYAVSPDIFQAHDLPEAFSFESDFQRPQVERVKMQAWPHCRYFIDIGVPDDYAKAQTELKEHIAA